MLDEGAWWSRTRIFVATAEVSLSEPPRKIKKIVTDEAIESKKEKNPSSRGPTDLRCSCQISLC